MTCIVVTTKFVLEKSMFAYKYAPHGASEYMAKGRSPLYGWPLPKEYDTTRLAYREGEWTRSPDGPGIMCYMDMPHFPSSDWYIMYIPEGTVCRWAMQDSKGAERVICASEVFTYLRMKPMVTTFAPKTYTNPIR